MKQRSTWLGLDSVLNRLNVIAFVWFVVVIFSISDGAIAFFWDYIFYFLGGLFLGIAWGLLMIKRLFSLRRNGFIRCLSWGSWQRYMIPLLILTAIFCRHTDIAFSIRFNLSEATLFRFATAVTSNSSLKEVRWVGLFPVYEVGTIGQSVWITTGQCGVFHNCGLVYSPNPKPPTYSAEDYTQLSNGWWHWRRDVF